MKSRPILFSAPMVRALLDGRKTQTRRVVKHQATSLHVQPYRTPQGLWNWVLKGTGVGTGDPFKCPYGVPGDRLWVKETHAVNVPGCERGLSYRADHNDPKGDGPTNPMRWIPSIHMRREYSRLTLEVTGVRIERLRAISEVDANAEGCAECGWNTACDEFFELWESINGAAFWDPWVWVVSFRKVVAP